MKAQNTPANCYPYGLQAWRQSQGNSTDSNTDLSTKSSLPEHRKPLKMKRMHTTILVSLFLALAIFHYSAAPGAELGGGIWQEENIAFLTYPASFTTTGPALEAVGEIYSLALGANGEIFFTQSDNPGIFVIASGVIQCVAGCGIRGFRDGPAALAMFNPGGWGYRYNDLAVDRKRGVIYFADGLNARIRKIYKDGSGKWMVSTFAGGGKTALQEGQSDIATAVDLGVAVAVAVDNEGNVYTCPTGCIVKITPDGRATKVLVFPDDGYPVFRHVVDLTADNNGNIFGIARGDIDGCFEYTKNGKYIRLTYLSNKDEGATWDGPVETANFHGPSTIAVDPAGSIIYAGGGDELCLRKIEDRRVSTLQQDGTWQETSQVNSGWRIGSVRAVGPEGSLYVANTQMTGLSLRKLIRLK